MEHTAPAETDLTTEGNTMQNELEEDVVLSAEPENDPPEEPEIPNHGDAVENSTNVGDLVKSAKLIEAMQEAQEEGAGVQMYDTQEEAVEERKPSLLRSFWETVTNFFKKFFRKKP